MIQNASTSSHSDPVVKARDAWSVVLLFDPLAIPLARLLSQRGASPNAVTVTSVGIALSTALVAALGTGTLSGLAVATGYYLSFLLDCVDGKVARLRGLSSAHGAAVDLMGDAWKSLALGTALLYRANAITDQVQFVVLLVTIMGLETLKVLSRLRTPISGRPAPLLDPLRPSWFPRRFVTVPSSIDVEVLTYGVWLPLTLAGCRASAAAAVAAAIVGTHLLREAYGTASFVRAGTGS